MGGHAAHQIYEVLDKFMELPVKHKPDGVCIMPVNSDRGGKFSVPRLLFQRLAEWENSMLDGSVAKTLRCLQAWPLVCWCALHDLHGALADSLQETLVMTGTPAKDIHKNMFKTVRSARESYDQLMDEIDEWVMAHVSWDEQDFCFEAVLEWWLQLGIREDLAMMLAERNMRFEENRLLAHVSFRSREGVHAETVTILLGVLRLAMYSKGRFVGAGKSFSAMVAGTYLGLDSLIAKVCAEPDQGTWYLSGYACWTQGTRLLKKKFNLFLINN